MLSLHKINYSPKVWGPPAWQFLHFVALSYPSNPTLYERRSYKTFFSNLKNVLPCSDCNHNYKNHFRVYDIDNYLQNPQRLFKWTVLIRNAVKRDLIRKGEASPMELLDTDDLKKKIVNQATYTPFVPNTKTIINTTTTATSANDDNTDDESAEKKIEKWYRKCRHQQFLISILLLTIILSCIWIWKY